MNKIKINTKFIHYQEKYMFKEEVSKIKYYSNISSLKYLKCGSFWCMTQFFYGTNYVFSVTLL